MTAPRYGPNADTIELESRFRKIEQQLRTLSNNITSTDTSTTSAGTATTSSGATSGTTGAELTAPSQLRLINAIKSRVFEWEATLATNFTEFEIQIATNPGFTENVQIFSSDEATFEFSSAVVGVQYYAKVRQITSTTSSAFSSVLDLSTGQIVTGDIADDSITTPKVEEEAIVALSLGGPLTQFINLGQTDDIFNIVSTTVNFPSEAEGSSVVLFCSGLIVADPGNGQFRYKYLIRKTDPNLTTTTIKTVVDFLPGGATYSTAQDIDLIYNWVDTPTLLYGDYTYSIDIEIASQSTTSVTLDITDVLIISSLAKR